MRAWLMVLAVLAFAAVPAAAQVTKAQTKPAGSTKPATKPSEAAAPGAIVNLNTATQAQLEALPGLGAKVAERIIEYRKQNGGFKKVEDLMNVKGIGEKSFLKLKPRLTVSDKAQPAGDSR